MKNEILVVKKIAQNFYQLPLLKSMTPHLTQSSLKFALLISFIKKIC